MRRNIILLVVLTITLLVGIPGCKDKSNDADFQMQQQTTENMKEAASQIGMPAIKNFQEKKLAKMIYELRDQEKILCYAYLKSLDGKPVYLGKCIGFGLPYSVQFSNPERVAELDRLVGWDRTGLGPLGTIPQPEPNGLFMPEGLSATWLMMVDPKTNEARPVYIEPEIIVSPFPLPNAIGGPTT